MSPPAEPLGTYLMPLYAGASWVGIVAVKSPFSTVLPVSLFGAAWALRNTLVGANFDLGIVSMGLVAATIGLDMGLSSSSASNSGIKGINTILAVESLFVAFNYVIPFFIWEQLEKALAKSKSILWFKVFKGYLVVQTAYWFYVAYRCFTKDQTKRFD